MMRQAPPQRAVQEEHDEAASPGEATAATAISSTTHEVLRHRRRSRGRLRQQGVLAKELVHPLMAKGPHTLLPAH